MSSKEYTLFNVFFVALLFCLFLTSLFLDENNNSLSCQILEITGTECKSCGLTRDFIAFSHLDFRSPINKHSIFIFVWFLFQLIGRTVIVLRLRSIDSKLIMYDFIILLFTGILVFLPFWT